MPAPATFGVTADTLHDQFFPQANRFSTNSSPTLSTVTTRILWAASDLDGALTSKNINGSSITDATSAAYLWCSKTIHMMAACELINVMTGVDPEWAKKLERDTQARFKAIEVQGIAALGSGVTALAGEDGVGPSTHIDEFNLDAGDTTLASDVIPPFRKSDGL